MLFIKKIPLNERVKIREDLISQTEALGFDFYAMSVVSAVIATLGLIVNSAAVVIGAMLISPLFFPVLTLAMSVVRGKAKNFQHSLTKLGISILIMFAVSFLVSLLVPMSTPTSEIMLRAQPNILHLFIALFSGLAGAFALIFPRVSTSLTGTLVAVSLLPPISAVGFGLAKLNSDIVGGSMLLFVANILSIIFVGVIVFYLFGFSPDHSENATNFIKTDLLWSAVLLILIAAPLSYSTYQSVEREKKVLAVRNIITSEFPNENLQSTIGVVIAKTVDGQKVTATIESTDAPSSDQFDNIKDDLNNYFKTNTELEFVIKPNYKIRY